MLDCDCGLRRLDFAAGGYCQLVATTAHVVLSIAAIAKDFSETARDDVVHLGDAAHISKPGELNDVVDLLGRRRFGVDDEAEMQVLDESLEAAH